MNGENDGFAAPMQTVRYRPLMVMLLVSPRINEQHPFRCIRDTLPGFPAKRVALHWQLAPNDETLLVEPLENPVRRPERDIGGGDYLSQRHWIRCGL